MIFHHLSLRSVGPEVLLISPSWWSRWLNGLFLGILILGFFWLEAAPGPLHWVAAGLALAALFYRESTRFDRRTGTVTSAVGWGPWVRQRRLSGVEITGLELTQVNRRPAHWQLILTSTDRPVILENLRGRLARERLEAWGQRLASFWNLNLTLNLLQDPGQDLRKL